MGRLIDADAWIQELRTQMSDKDCPGEIQDYCLFMINEINTRATAYDVEKVLEELEKAECHMIGQHYFEDGIAEAIDIVKRGGIPAAVHEGEVK